MPNAFCASRLCMYERLRTSSGFDSRSFGTLKMSFSGEEAPPRPNHTSWAGRPVPATAAKAAGAGVSSRKQEATVLSQRLFMAFLPRSRTTSRSGAARNNFAILVADVAGFGTHACDLRECSVAARALEARFERAVGAIPVQAHHSRLGRRRDRRSEGAHRAVGQDTRGVDPRREAA